MLFQSRAPPFVPPRDDVTIPQFLLDNVDPHFTRPARPAEVPCLIDEDSGKAVYLAQLQERSHSLAGAFRARWNISVGDVVSLYAPNHVDYCVVAWAIHRLGGIVATHSPSLTSEELVYQLKIVEPSVLIAHSENVQTAVDAMKKLNMSLGSLVLFDKPHISDVSLPFLDSLHEESRAYTEHKFTAGQARTAIAFLCFSSGTTGNPKAVAISHYNVVCNIIQGATFNRISEPYASLEDRRFRPGDICSGVLPLYHIYGLVVNLHFMIYAAMTVVVSKFNYENFLRSIDRFRITHLMIVPPQAVLFCKHPLTKKYDISSVRYCMVSAAPVSAELTNQLLEIFPGAHLGQGYGMTETSPTATMYPVTKKVGTLGSAGQLVSGTVAKVVKPDGTLAVVGEPGELYLQGPQIVLGYYKNEQATRETFVDGWLRTGDEAMFNEDGDLFITDRIKELIKVKGYQVAPSELEGHLLNHPDVADAAVIGVPDEYAGELPLAFVVLKPEVTAAVKGDSRFAGEVRSKLYNHISSVASRYKWLDGGIEFVDAVPKSTSGKILRRVLKDANKRRSRAPSRARL